MSIDDLEPRVREKIRQDPETGCWVWIASLNRGGYGQLGIGPHGVVRAHRYVYEQLAGPIPRGHVLDHRCERQSCVNPDHLEPITHRENTARWYRAHPEANFISARTRQTRADKHAISRSAPQP
jgi:hypothetical protein